MHPSPRRPCAETLWLPLRDLVGQRPISAQNLVSLIDLGWSDYRIACHFCVEPRKVSALRAYYGLVQQKEDSWVWRMRRQDRLANEG
jgi:hypothetical protein